MKNTKFLTICILPIIWSLYFIFEIVTGRVTDSITVYGNLGLILLFAFVGYILYVYSLKYSNGFSTKKTFIFFLILMVIDQGGKIIIKFFFFNDYFEIFKGFLSFHPIINTEGSWLNARFGTSVGFPLLITLNIFALFLFFELYRYHNHKNKQNYFTDMTFLFIFSGALCSLIDKVFYGGSLDFIGVSNLFIADIKDIYLNLGILFFIVSLISSGYLTDDDDTTLKDDMKSIKRFISFSIKDLSNILKIKRSR